MDVLKSNQSLGAILFDHLEETNQDSVAIIDGETDEKITFGKLYNTSRKWAMVLTSLGVKKEDVVLMQFRNSWLHMAISLACSYIGVTYSIVYENEQRKEIRSMLIVTKPRLIICEQKQLHIILDLKKEYNCIKDIICIDANSNKQIIGMKKMLEDQMNCTGLKLRRFSDDEDIALILKTTGTTGEGKCIGFTQKNLKTGMHHAFDARFEHFNKNDVVIGIMFVTLLGVQTGLSSILSGSRLVIVSDPSDEATLQAMTKYKVTKAILMSNFFTFLARSPLATSVNLSALQEIISTGSCLPNSVISTLKMRCKIPFIRQGYGSSESSTMVFLMPRNSQKENSVGILTSDEIQTQVVDVKTRQVLGPHNIGELLIFYSGIIKGYLKNEKANGDLFENGFLKTGDLGYYDQDNYFYIVDRIKNVIKYKSASIPSRDIEDALIEHPDIQDVAVVGVPNDKYVELATAFIVRKPAATVSEEEVLLWYNSSVCEYRQLHGGVQFINKIPRSINGKILKRELLEMS